VVAELLGQGDEVVWHFFLDYFGPGIR
jgi:hypothetical protein